MSWEFGKYVELEGAAEQAFDTGFDTLWRWHRSTQLTAYATDLREIAAASQVPLTREQVGGYLERARAHGRRLLDEALPPLARVLAALDDRQVERMLKKMARDRAEEAEEESALTPDERRARREREATRSVKRWLGSVSPEQAALVRDWALARRDDPALWQHYGEQWAEAFRLTLAARGEAGFEQRLRALFIEPRLPASQAADEINDFNRARFADLVARLSPTLSDPQRRHSRKELIDLAEDFEELAAKPV